MATHQTLTSLFNDIADAIREKTGDSESIVADEFPTAIENIPSGGGDTIDFGKEVVNGVLKNKANFTFKFPDDATSINGMDMRYAFYQNQGIIGVDFNDITTLGLNNLTNCFDSCIYLTNVDMKSVTNVTGDNRALFNGCIRLLTVDASGLINITGNYGLKDMCKSCTNLTSINFTSLTSVTSNYAFQTAFDSCTNLATINFNSLREITGNYAFDTMFNNDKNLTSVIFPLLSVINGNAAMSYCFYRCTGLTSLSFPALTVDSFGTRTNMFNNMLGGVTGCTVHFPASIQSKIGSWTDVTNGFGGTNTTVLFDL